MEWTPILIALISAGLFKAVVDGVKYVTVRRKAKIEAASPDGRHAVLAVTMDQSLAVVARARDELEADNTRLRDELLRADQRAADQQARHDAEIARRDLREKAMRDEIDALERKLRALLSEVERLKDRHTFDQIEDTNARNASPLHLPHGSQYPGAQGH